MSQKGRLRRLERGVEWLETEGRFRRIELMFKILDMKQEIADRLAVDPAAAAQWKKDYPDFPCELPPPGPHLRPRAPEPDVRPPPPKVEPPPPVPSPVSPPVPSPEIAAQPLPVIVAETPPPPPASVDVFPSVPSPEIAPWPPPVAPPHPPPSSPDLEYRPVHWRKRGEWDDDEEDRPGTNGRCITEYDPLRHEYDDDDYL